MSTTAQSATAALVRRPFRALRFTRDEELVRLVRAGDERAFEALYDRHHRGILAFCRHMLGSAEEAEDAVQHTFIAAHRDIVGSDKPIQLKAWLYTIARNRCLSVLRARKEERALEDVPEPSVAGLTAEVQQRQDLRDLLADLQRLPEDQRAALVLSELGALSHEEIGATLGVRKDKVKALVFQARESLASSRSAREADCREIQEQLSVLRGGSLRRTTLRRHVEVCPACAAFKAEVKRQRGAMAAILPVVPSLALKESVLAALFGGGAAGGGGIIGGGLLAASGTKALVAKVASIAVVAGGATGGGLVAVDEISNDGRGGTATAMAGIPAEQRSVEMVESLRDRAEQTADKREADRRAARSASASASSASTSGEPAVVEGRRPRAGTRARRRGKAVGTSGARPESRAGVPAADPAPAPPPSAPAAAPPPQPAPAPAAPAKGKQKEKEREDDDRDENDRDDDDRKDRKKPKLPRPDKQRGPGIDPQPDRGNDDEHGHRRRGDDDDDDGRRGKGRRPKVPKAELPKLPKPSKAPRQPKQPKQPAPAPQQPQAPQPPRDGRDDRERGRGRGGDDDRGKARKSSVTPAVPVVTPPTER